jgi:hypothetical protein
MAGSDGVAAGLCPVRAAVGVLWVAAMLLVGCARTDGGAAGPASGAASDAGSAWEHRDVDLGPLDHADVTYPLMGARGGLLPILVHGDRSTRSAIFLLDSRAGRIVETPDLPDVGWLGDTSLAATDTHVVASSWVCSTPTTEEDAGRGCDDYADGEHLHVEVLILDIEAQRWRQFDLTGVADAQPWIDVVDGETALLVGEKANAPGYRDGTPLRWSLDLSDGVLRAVGTDTPPAPRCPGVQSSLRLAEAGGRTVAEVIDERSGETETFELPAAARPDWPAAGRVCLSAGRFVALPGGEGFAGPQNTVYDLTRPEAEPLRYGKEVFSDIQSADDYWIAEAGDGVHLYSAASGQGPSLKRTGTQAAFALDGGAVILKSDGDGQLTTVDLYRAS